MHHLIALEIGLLGHHGEAVIKSADFIDEAVLLGLRARPDSSPSQVVQLLNLDPTRLADNVKKSGVDIVDRLLQRGFVVVVPGPVGGKRHRCLIERDVFHVHPHPLHQRAEAELH